MASNNTTYFPLPNGASQHGSPHLLCLPPQWKDIALFYISNYFAHAATLHSHPGQKPLETLRRGLNALFIPFMGIFDGISLLGKSSLTSLLGTNPLYVAALCGALCTVRKKLPSRATTNILEDPIAFSETIMPDRYIQGIHICPEGYELTILPFNTPLRFVTASSETARGLPIPSDSDIRIPSTYSIPKTLISLIQAFWSISTLYMARGEQIQKYGYAAFGFTVIPYAVMSVVNLLANVFLPEYPCLYLVSSPDMEEAIQLGGVFHPIVAAVDFNKELGVRTIEKETWRSRLTRRNIFFHILDNLLGFVRFFAAFSALIIVGCMSQFKANDSTVMQRGWMITWTVAGLAFPVIINIILVSDRLSSKHKDLVGKYLPIIGYVPAIGGMIVVGYMIQDYGICTFFS